MRKVALMALCALVIGVVASPVFAGDAKMKNEHDVNVSFVSCDAKAMTMTFKTPDGEPGLNYLCGGWKNFFSHIDEPVQKVVRGLGVQVRREAVTRAADHWVPVKSR